MTKFLSLQYILLKDNHLCDHFYKEKLLLYDTTHKALESNAWRYSHHIVPLLAGIKIKAHSGICFS